jgi:uncharacterized protein YgiM (DUF1202 family)
MSARRFLFSVLSATIVLIASSRAIAQDVPPEVDNFKNSGIGRVTADNVYVKSGAGESYYPTTKLNKGAEVTVVGGKFDWLKVLPPPGSFCYIAKAFVDKGEGSTGKVNRDDVNVRAGSDVNTMKTTVQAKLAAGTTVQILGESDEYYKIKPPGNAFVYVNKKDVEFVKAIPSVVAADGTVRPAAPGAAPAQTPQNNPSPVAEAGAGASANAGAGAQKSTIETDAAPVASATTQPSPDQQFDQLEARFNEASAKPIEQQPIAELRADYTKLINDARLPESMRRIAVSRTRVLDVRAKTKTEFLAVQKEMQEAAKKREALKAEQVELAAQSKKTEVQMYTAVGTLRTSSLQNGSQMLYRLTDPANGRTVVYLRSSDPAMGQSLGQFIGVKGELVTDPQMNLKTVQMTNFQPVDPNQLFRGVASQIVPPSLVPSAGQAQQASAGQQ